MFEAIYLVTLMTQPGEALKALHHGSPQVVESRPFPTQTTLAGAVERMPSRADNTDGQWLHYELDMDDFSTTPRRTTEENPYPSWRWFERHRDWLRLEQSTRFGSNTQALFAHWSPFSF
ncbi:MAG: hypothetical protein AAF384_13320 [Pseudomonadota bacterium]